MPFVNPELNRRQFLKGATVLPIIASIPLASRVWGNDRNISADFWRALYQTIMHPLHADEDKALKTIAHFYDNISERDRVELNLGVMLLRGPITWLHGQWRPFEFTSLEARQSILLSLKKAPGDLYVLYQGLKEMCQLAHYSQDESFQLIGYTGPIVDESMDRSEFYQSYEELRAPITHHETSP